jgi:vacuolar-type H+-ATPase subunit I/STV1
MLYEQYQPQDLLTPSIGDDGINKLNSSLTSLDFYLLDDIDTYLSPVQSTKAIHNDIINDSLNDNSQHQEDFFSDFDLVNFDDFEEKSDFLADSISIDEIDIEKWISQASFPSPTDTNSSPLSSIEDSSSIESPINKDMIVPSSPSLSSTDSSPKPSTKKPKLSTLERRLRKKNQNKTAAEKYRIRKKSERHQLLDQHLKLTNTNKELKLELENLAYRVHQFKQLFTDIVQIDLPTSK